MHECDRFQARRLYAAIAALCFAIIAAGRPAAAEDARLAALRDLALQLVNASRAENRLPPLALDGKLSAAAQSHAADMLKRNYFAHDSPEGKNVGDRYQAAGGNEWALTAENIGKCAKCFPPLSEADLRMIHEGWMKSPGHRENILRKGLTTFGFGMISNGTGGLYAVQTFSGPGAQKGAESGAGAKPVAPGGVSRAALDALNERRKKGGREPLELSRSLTEAAATMAVESSRNSSASGDGGPLRVANPAGAVWRVQQIFSGQCGGCGSQTVLADVDYFIQEWLSDQTYANMLLDGGFTHLGFAIHATGDGMKTAIGLLARQ